MKSFKNLHYIFYLIMLILMNHQITQAQIAICKNAITVSTLPWDCSYTVVPSDIDDGSSDYSKLTLNQTKLSKGTHQVTLTAEKSNGALSFCTCTVNVIDKSAPVVIAVQNLTVALNAQNRIALTPSLVNNGSYDHCSPVSMTISPNVIDCNSPNPLKVTLTVTDSEGNYNQGITEVNIIQNKNRIKAIVCKGDITFGVPPKGSFEITADSLLEGMPYACPGYYNVVLKYNNISLPEPKVSIADVGKTFDYVVTDPETQNTCFGKVTIVGLDCSNALKVYDTFDRCTVAGDIASGHTLLDDVEWPCDITINNAPQFLINNPDPSLIADYLNVDIDSIKPIFFNGVPNINKCILLGESIKVDPFLFEKIAKITYRYLNWVDDNFVPVSYVQRIKFNTSENACTPCDTQPWNTPLGDCASGHTINDAVEWPADITVDFSEVSPYDLSLNPAIHPNNVEPKMNEACPLEWLTSYTDLVVQINVSEYTIDRTWTLLNPQINETYTYIQRIFINAAVSNEREVCFSTMHDIPITDVAIQANVVSKSDGCNDIIFDTSTKIIGPFKAGTDFQAGIDVEDVLMFKDYIWKITTLDTMQKSASDLNNDGNLNNIDVNLLQNLWTNQISDISAYNSPWKFINANVFFVGNELVESSDISSPFERYHFKGMKIGDLNDSYGRDEGITKITSFVLGDQLLTQGQIYVFKIAPQIDIKIKGFQFAIEKNDAFDITDVLSPFVKVHLIDKGNYYLIAGVAEDIALKGGGEYVDNMSSILKIYIKANRNAVLHDVFKLYEKENKMVQGSNSELSKIQLNFNNSIPSSLLDFYQQNTVIFPNPTTGIVNISSSVESVNAILITTFDGKLIYSSTDLSSQTIDVSHLSNGFYTLDLVMGNGMHITKKLVKM